MEFIKMKLTKKDKEVLVFLIHNEIETDLDYINDLNGKEEEHFINYVNELRGIRNKLK